MQLCFFTLVMPSLKWLPVLPCCECCHDDNIISWKLFQISFQWVIYAYMYLGYSHGRLESSLQFWNVVVAVAGSTIDAHRRAERMVFQYVWPLVRHSGADSVMRMPLKRDLDLSCIWYFEMGAWYILLRHWMGKALLQLFSWKWLCCSELLWQRQELFRIRAEKQLEVHLRSCVLFVSI